MPSYFNGQFIWHDGDNVYYSYNDAHYVLNKATSTWETKTWNGISSLFGNYIWTDGTDIYYSHNNGETFIHYVLDRATSTWSAKTWNYSNFEKSNIWYDGTNVYLFTGTYNMTNKILNKTTGEWEYINWNSVPSDQFNSFDVWTDGTVSYFSVSNHHYIIDTTTYKFTAISWTGLNFKGRNVWTDGTNIYFATNSLSKIFDKSTQTWSNKTWISTVMLPNGEYVWTDNTKVYYDDGYNVHAELVSDAIVISAI